MTTVTFSSVCGRLTNLGFPLYSECSPEGLIIERAVITSEIRIRSKINQSSVPEELCPVWEDMAVGLFLSELKSADMFDTVKNAVLPDFEQAVENIREGDVCIEYKGSADGCLSPEARFDRFVQSLMNPPDSVFLRYRRLAW